MKKKTKDAKIQVTIQLEQEALQKIDEVAERVKLSRSQLCANLIVMGLDDAKLLDDFGLISVAGYIRGMLDHFNSNKSGSKSKTVNK
jgi:metal-responsive CopG/Arc/MetJ family transcriptional regulator